MDDGGPTASIILFCVLLVIEMIFFAFGAAVQLQSFTEFEKSNEGIKRPGYKFISKTLDKPSQFIITLQVVVTMIYMVMGGVYFKLISEQIQEFILMLKEQKVALFSVIQNPFIEGISFLLTGMFLLMITVVFGVLLPKKIASRHPGKCTSIFWLPVACIVMVFYPLSVFFNFLTKSILYLFGIKSKTDHEDVTEEEIISMVNEGQEQGILLASEAEMITNIFEYGEKEAQDIMTLRMNIISIDGESLIEDAIQYMLEEGNSRYPVYLENLDHIIGILNLKDALRIHKIENITGQPIKDIPNLLRKVVFIPETRKIDVLFQNMQADKTQLVIVVDEYGQTSGLITTEDILEEIVGNIMDEYDEEEETIQEKSDSEFMVDGMTRLDQLEELLSIQFNEEEFDTLNGFLISQMDHIPEENEEFEIDIDGYNFKVVSVENKMIQSVLVTKLIKER